MSETKDIMSTKYQRGEKSAGCSEIEKTKSCGRQTHDDDEAIKDFFKTLAFDFLMHRHDFI